MHTPVDCRAFKHEPQESEGQFKGVMLSVLWYNAFLLVWVNAVDKLRNLQHLSQPPSTTFESFI